SNCGLVYARSCFRMNAFERNIEATEELEEVGHERILQAASQDGIPKHAGCQRDQVPVRLVCCRARRFGEVEPLVFQGKHGPETRIRRIGQHFLKKVSRAY